MGTLHALLTGLLQGWGLGAKRTGQLDRSDVGRRRSVRGTVMPRDQIDSTLTGEPCVYYQYTVEEWRQSYSVHLGVDGYWSIVQRDEALAEFYLVTETQRIIVSPAHARVERGHEVEVSAVDLGGIHDRRAQQFMIGAGDIIEVVGTVSLAVDTFDEGRGYRSDPERLMLSGTEAHPLNIRLIRRGRDDVSESSARAL